MGETFVDPYGYSVTEDREKEGWRVAKDGLDVFVPYEVHEAIELYERHWF